VALTSALLAGVLDQVALGRDRLGDDLLAQLRAGFPGVHFSLCSDDDVPARLTPAVANAYCRLYYVDSSAHCLQLTNDGEAASGLLVALLDPEES
jgi:hypothetical protein